MIERDTDPEASLASMVDMMFSAVGVGAVIFLAFAIVKAVSVETVQPETLQTVFTIQDPELRKSGVTFIVRFIGPVGVLRESDTDRLGLKVRPGAQPWRDHLAVYADGATSWSVEAPSDVADNIRLQIFVATPRLADRQQVSPLTNASLKIEATRLTGGGATISSLEIKQADHWQLDLSLQTMEIVSLGGKPIGWSKRKAPTVKNLGCEKNSRFQLAKPWTFEQSSYSIKIRSQEGPGNCLQVTDPSYSARAFFEVHGDFQNDSAVSLIQKLANAEYSKRLLRNDGSWQVNNGQSASLFYRRTTPVSDRMASSSAWLCLDQTPAAKVFLDAWTRRAIAAGTYSLPSEIPASEKLAIGRGGMIAIDDDTGMFGKSDSRFEPAGDALDQSELTFDQFAAFSVASHEESDQSIAQHPALFWKRASNEQ